MISWRGRYQFDKIANCITNHHSEKLEKFAVAEMALQLFISLRQDFCTAPYFIVHTVQRKMAKVMNCPWNYGFVLEKYGIVRKSFHFSFTLHVNRVFEILFWVDRL